MLSDLETRETSIRVLVADSSRIHTHLLAEALKGEAEFEVIPFDSESNSLVSAVIDQGTEVLLLSADLNKRLSGGFEVLRELRTVLPNLRAVVLMHSSDEELVLNAFRAGVRGIFDESQPVELIAECVRRVHQGQIWASNREIGLIVDALASAPVIRNVDARGLTLLSKRELEVVRCLAEGLTNREIAKRLELSQHTVKNHLFRVFEKLGVSSRIELLSMTLSHTAPGLLQESSKSVGRDGFRSEFAILHRAAEAGLPAAQLALAQICLMRRTEPRDAVRAYTWYLVALEKASQAKGFITKMLTPEQIEEAHREASAKLSQPDAELTSDFGWPPPRRAQ
jgi:two-component system, NarL family, nitrate/nitrite response regulator NarL